MTTKRLLANTTNASLCLDGLQKGQNHTGAELSPRFVGFTAVLVETSRILRQLALCKAWSWVSCEAVEICNLHSHFWRTNPWIIHLRTHLSNGFIPTPLVESPGFQVNQSRLGIFEGRHLQRFGIPTIRGLWCPMTTMRQVHVALLIGGI